MSGLSFAEPAVWSFAFAFAVLAAFAVQIVLGWRGGTRAAMLLAAVILSMLWAGVGLAFALTDRADLWNVTRFLDLARIGAWCAFLLMLLRSGTQDDRAANEVQSASGRSMAILLGVLLIGGAVLPIDPPTGVLPLEPQHRAGFVMHVGLSILGLVLVEQLLRSAPASGRWGLKPLCLGLGGAFIYDLFMYADASLFGILDADIWSAHGAIQALVVPFVAISAVRNKQWTVNIHLSRQVVFQSTALLGSGVYLLAAAAIGYYIRFFGGTWGRTLQIALLFGALLLLGLLFTSGTLRAKLRVFVNKNFYSYRYDYREEWLKFTRILSAPEASSNVQEQSIRALCDLVESPSGGLWLKSDEQGFRPAARWNTATMDAIEPADSAFARFLADSGWVINLEEFRQTPQRYAGLALPQWLAELASAWVVVPLATNDELIGFVVLSNPRVKVEVNWEVLDLLKTAGRQAAGYLGYIRAAEALLESKKFDAFNRMSAFVVHDLKNLVSQLSLMLKNAERHRDNPEFQQDMLETVQHVVGRMNHLLLQLRSGATPIEKPKAVDLSAVAGRVQRAKGDGTRRLSVEAPSGIMVFGHEDRLEHVVGHLVQNALDAIGPQGRVVVKVYDNGRPEAGAVVEVEDDGIGMTPDFVREKLFRPFQTTKPTGMGIGIYESAQYVGSIGGRLLVESEPNRGTRIKVVLPRHAASDSPAGMSEAA